MSSIYLVRRDGWYAERAVWGIAGAVILAGTALGAFVHPVGAALITCTGLFSLLTAFTGYCPMSSLLVSAGMPAHLGGPVAQRGPVAIYRMRTDAWYLERGIYVVVGTTQTVASVLSWVHGPGWLGFTAFVGAMAIGFAFSGFCPVANVLYRLGFEPRLLPPEVADAAA